jgi:hypothetical protein
MKMLLMQIPGLMITGNKVTVRGGSAPLVVLDDVPDENLDPLSLPVSDISDLFLIKDASAGALFGPQAGSGALIITTKRGFIQKNTTSHNIGNLIELLGFQTPIEFYSPRYDATQRHTTTDLRTTLYWNPTIRVPETGEITFDFYSSDAATTYSVVLEGLSDQGHLIYGKAKIQRTEKSFRE